MSFKGYAGDVAFVAGVPFRVCKKPPPPDFLRTRKGVPATKATNDMENERDNIESVHSFLNIDFNKLAYPLNDVIIPRIHNAYSSFITIGNHPKIVNKRN